MIADVNKALTAFRALTTQGKKLFRDELGLVRPQQAKRKTRKRTVDILDVTPTKRMRSNKSGQPLGNVPPDLLAA
jgi:hypothetical protein